MWMPFRLTPLLCSACQTYTNWQTAAKLISDAVEVSADGDTILVTDGTHSSQFPHIPLANAIALISVNGCHATTVTCTTMRGFNLGNTGAVMAGFTVINGLGVQGGGAIVETGTLRNCVFVNCQATSGDGVGLYVGEAGMVQGCVISNCQASQSGGGIYNYFGTVENTIVQRNRALSSDGGGIHSIGGIIRGCVAAFNSNSYVNARWRDRALFYFSGTLESGTVSDNAALGEGGGIYGGPFGTSVVRNTIIYFNMAGGAGSNHYGMLSQNITNCCTAPAIGTACVDAEPRFVNRGAGNFRLAWGSPCLDSAVEQDWMIGGTDLDGDLRVWNGEADIGAYEAMNILADTDGNGMPDGWENERFGWPVSGANPAADEDGDLIVNLDKRSPTRILMLPRHSTASRTSSTTWSS